MRSMGTTRARKSWKKDGSAKSVSGGQARARSRPSMASRVVQHAALQRGEGLQPLLAQVPPQPPQQQRPRVVAQVEAIVAPDALEEQLHLEGLQLRAVGDAAHSEASVRWALGR